MRIDLIRIDNFKKFEHIDLRFTGNFTLIIGKNGTGKTSILEAICVGLGGYLAKLDGVRPKRSFKEEEIRRDLSPVGDGSFHSVPQFPVKVQCQGNLFGNPANWTRLRETLDGHVKNIGSDIATLARNAQRQINDERIHDIILPLISYQSAGRLFSQKRERWVNPFSEQEMSRFVGYTGCLEEESDMKLMTHWFRRMKGLELQEKRTIGEFQSVLQAVNTFMADMEEGDWGGIDFDFFQEEIIINLQGQWLPIRMLSAGYRGLIGMVTDLAYRMSVLNPQLTDQATQLTPGVILIDELDLHLHPQWQWRVVKSLRKTFPKLQFIATTHAPIVIGSCADGQIIDLGASEGSTSATTPYGWRIQDVLSEWMGTEDRDEKIEREIDTLRELFAKQSHHKLTDEEQQTLDRLIRKLRRLLPESDPVVTLAKLDAIGRADKGSPDHETDQ